MILVNPGSGPCAGATEENARANIDALVEEVDGEVHVALRGGSTGGRWLYQLTAPGHRCEVEMPGWPLHEVKDGRPDDISRPRLYVDGSSWYWEFAVDIIRDTLQSP